MPERPCTSYKAKKVDKKFSANEALSEYLKRLSRFIKEIPPENFQQTWKECILNFANSSCWKKPLDLKQSYFNI